MFYGILVLECLLFAIHLRLDRLRAFGINWLEITSFLAIALMAFLVNEKIAPFSNPLAFSFFFSITIAIRFVPRTRGPFQIIVNRVFFICVLTGATYSILLLYNHWGATFLYIIAIVLITIIEGFGYYSRYGPESLKGAKNLESGHPEITKIIKDALKEISYLELFFYNDDRINAHLLRKSAHKTSLILSSGAIKELNYNEMYALLLHEKAHLIKKHRHKVVLCNYLCSLVFITLLYVFLWVYGSILGICLFLSITDFFIDVAVVLKNYLSYKLEWEADSYVCKYGYKEYLLSALRKASSNNNKMARKEQNNILLSKHPSIQNRINRINQNETRERPK